MNVQNNKRKSASVQNVRSIQTITWIGAIINIILCFGKIIVGSIGKSQALIADGIHSFSDLSTDGAILLGVRIWSKPADEEHPYGHHRFELIITGAISLVLFAAGLSIGYHALITLQEHESSSPGKIAIITAFFSIITKEILYRYTRAIAKRERSSALIANAWHHRTDALSSIPVAIAVGLSTVSSRWSFMDHLGAFVVSLFILYTAWGMLRKVVFDIIDTSAPQKYRTLLEQIALQTPGVQSIHALRTRKIGSGWYIDLHIQVDPGISVRRGHDIAKEVKQNFFNHTEEVLDVLVHLEPFLE